jgi:hypothetical protein
MHTPAREGDAQMPPSAVDVIDQVTPSVEGSDPGSVSHQLSRQLEHALGLHRRGQQQQALKCVAQLAEDMRGCPAVPMILLLRAIWLRKCILVAMQ